MKNLIVSVVFLVFCVPEIYPRSFIPFLQKYASSDSAEKKGQNVRIMFYNLENLYDPYDDSLKMDEEFTAAGIRHWNYSRFQIKLNHLYKTIMAAGKWEPPAIIGFCEAENRYVLNKLIFSTPLKNFGYRIVHYDSPDLRGVDVALLYRTSVFRPLFSKPVRIIFPFDTNIRTRDILYVKGLLFEKDTVNILVNHWPSRRGGFTESQPRRNYVAGCLKKLTDSLLLMNPQANIIIMGDFNDEPDCESLEKYLMAGKSASDSAGLVNLMYRFTGKASGTHKFQGHWGVLDQFIISSALLKSDNNPTFKDVHIFSEDFLMKEDEKYFGSSPEKTYNGPRYTGGFSDHLPILLDIFFK